jgi:16S rRNA (cytosine1402-N4)-methyltransferase
MRFRHESAMLQEAVTSLGCRPGRIYVDGTLGGAGHARLICQQIVPTGTLIGIDRDADAIANARDVLRPYQSHIHLIHGNFVDLPDHLAQLGIEAVDGILLDLGLSQYQLEASGRGFSFNKDEPLDMRMDVRTRTNAQDLINQATEAALIRIFKEYGQERWSKQIARAVIKARSIHSIGTTRQLVELVQSAVPRGAAAQQKIHPATRVFMALRIAVNRELENLRIFLTGALDLLIPGGRLCVLAFHSLEDRLVKHHFKAWAATCTCPPQLPQCLCRGRARARLVTKKVMRPTRQEVDRNPMARSTRLRAVEKL